LSVQVHQYSYFIDSILLLWSQSLDAKLLRNKFQKQLTNAISGSEFQIVNNNFATVPDSPLCKYLEKNFSCKFCSYIFLELHSKTHTLTTRTHTHPYEYTYANPTPVSTSEELSTGRSGDSQSHQRRLVVDGNVAYHLMQNASKSWKIQKKVKMESMHFV
jgi:hypothetical protein